MILTIPHSDRNLVLTGYSGPNQMMVVRRVAEKLGMPFVNFETRLETLADMPYEDLRVRYGEARLKTLEAEVVEEMVLYRGAVMLISGQTLKHSDHLTRIGDTGMVLCLVATLDAVLQRLHLSLGARYHNPAERAMALGNLKREWAIRSLPGVEEFDTTAMGDGEIITSIVALWREQALLVRG
jgi:shikimate kinase